MQPASSRDQLGPRINGVEVDPGFNDNGYVYVSYVGTDDVEQLASRFTVAPIRRPRRVGLLTRAASSCFWRGQT